MNFSLTQIVVTYLSFFVCFIFAYFWQKKEKNSVLKEDQKESFPVLMSVFFYSAFGALFLKMLIDLLMQTNPVLIQDKEYLVVALEELVKIIALIFGLEIADKRFNELSDGIVYAVFTALGFIFFENILYLLSGNLDIWSFVLVFLSRLIFSFGAHLSIILFGVTYAEAYLHTSPKLLKKLKQKNEARIKPYHFHRILKFLYDKYHIFIIFYLPLSPIILLFQLYEQKHPITMSELIFSGILGSIYLHIIYDLLLNINIPWLNTVVLSIFGIFALSIYHYFPKLEVH